MNEFPAAPRASCYGKPLELQTSKEQPTPAMRAVELRCAALQKTILAEGRRRVVEVDADSALLRGARAASCHRVAEDFA